jgi:hypothetical protein
MQKLLSAEFRLSVILLYCCNLFFPCLAQAEDTGLAWGGQLYGGEYYKDNIIGAYGISSTSFGDDLTITGEILGERYHNRDRDYDLSGVGAHLLWKLSEFTKFGVAGSHADERFNYSDNFEGLKSKYLSNTLGLEGEFDHDPVALAAQAGKVANDNNGNYRRYFSINFFYWGAEHLWYVRSAIRKVKNYKEYILEGNRTLFADSFPTNLYVGTTQDDVITNDEILAPHRQYNSFYTGCNFQLIATSSSVWNLWAEAARQASDTILSVELNISFGPGVDAPYISALDYAR